MSLRCLVPVKRVIDYAVKIQVLNGAVNKKVKHSINPFDEVAVEHAVQLKEKKLLKEITALSIGDSKASEVLRTALAMGADNAIHLTTDAEAESLEVAKLVAAKAKDFDLIIFGKQAIDDDCGCAPQMVAGLLGWPQAVNCSGIEVKGKTAKVTREIDGGLEKFEMDLPAVFSVDLR